MVAQIQPKGIQCENMIPVIWILLVPFVRYLYHLCANRNWFGTMICAFCPHKLSTNSGDGCTNSTKGCIMRKSNSHYLDIFCGICLYLCNLCANQNWFGTMVWAFRPDKLSTNVGDGCTNSIKECTMQKSYSRSLDIVCVICADLCTFVR